MLETYFYYSQTALVLEIFLSGRMSSSDNVNISLVKKSKQLHAVSRTQQGRQREPSGTVFSTFRPIETGYVESAEVNATFCFTCEIEPTRLAS